MNVCTGHGPPPPRGLLKKKPCLELKFFPWGFLFFSALFFLARGDWAGERYVFRFTFGCGSLLMMVPNGLLQSMGLGSHPAEHQMDGTVSFQPPSPFPCPVFIPVVKDAGGSDGLSKADGVMQFVNTNFCKSASPKIMFVSKWGQISPHIRVERSQREYQETSVIPLVVQPWENSTPSTCSGKCQECLSFGIFIYNCYPSFFNSFCFIIFLIFHIIHVETLFWIIEVPPNSQAFLIFVIEFLILVIFWRLFLIIPIQSLWGVILVTCLQLCSRCLHLTCTKKCFHRRFWKHPSSCLV